MIAIILTLPWSAENWTNVLPLRPYNTELSFIVVDYNVDVRPLCLNIRLIALTVRSIQNAYGEHRSPRFTALTFRPVIRDAGHRRC